MYIYCYFFSLSRYRKIAVLLSRREFWESSNWIKCFEWKAQMESRVPKVAQDQKWVSFSSHSWSSILSVFCFCFFLFISLSLSLSLLEGWVLQLWVGFEWGYSLCWGQCCLHNWLLPWSPFQLFFWAVFFSLFSFSLLGGPSLWNFKFSVGFGNGSCQTRVSFGTSFGYLGFVSALLQ